MRPPGHPPGAPVKPGRSERRLTPPPGLSQAVPPHEGPPSQHGMRQWQLLDAASWHYFARDSRVHLHVPYLTTLSSSAYKSLWSIYKRPVQDRRLAGISASDLAHFKKHLEANIRDWHASQYNLAASRVDYLGIVDVIVDRTAGRLSRMRSALNASDPSEGVKRVKEEVNDMLFPYLDIPRTLWEGKDRPDARTRHAAIQRAKLACSTTFTGFVNKDSLQDTEELVVTSIERVLSRTCDVAANILEDSLSMQVRAMSEGMRARYELKLLEGWRRKVEELVSWLDWPIWRTCKNACADNVSKTMIAVSRVATSELTFATTVQEICYMPMWPVIIGDGNGAEPGPGGASMPGESRPIEEPRCVRRM